MNTQYTSQLNNIKVEALNIIRDYVKESPNAQYRWLIVRGERYIVNCLPHQRSYVFKWWNEKTGKEEGRELLTDLSADILCDMADQINTKTTTYKVKFLKKVNGHLDRVLERREFSTLEEANKYNLTQVDLRELQYEDVEVSFVKEIEVEEGKSLADINSDNWCIIWHNTHCMYTQTVQEYKEKYMQ